MRAVIVAFGSLLFSISVRAKQAPLAHITSESILHVAKTFSSDGAFEERITASALPQHTLRITTASSTLCDPDVKQYVGYLDVDRDGSKQAKGHHLFFWFFESRRNPLEDPLVMWLNGGPGCSSITGLLFELGPCTITSDGTNTTWNPHSWTERANVLFLDQPIRVGFSYSDDPSDIVDTSPQAAQDVWAFMQLFLGRFPEYSDLAFHIAAESYGGTYAPNIAHVINGKNKLLSEESGLRRINLESIMLGNGLSDPYYQFGSIPEYACNGPFKIYNDSTICDALVARSETCQRLIQNCYDFDTRLTCLPSFYYCWTKMYDDFDSLNRNPYDVRKPCNLTANPLCYDEIPLTEVYMNQPHVKRALGVDPSNYFTPCNGDVQMAFWKQGDGMKNSAALLPPLLKDGIRLLVYAGNADFVCNFMGEHAWMLRLESLYREEFQAANLTEWNSRYTGKAAGEVRSAGRKGYTMGNYTFVSVHNAGHMVPFDQPEHALELLVSWTTNTRLTYS